MKCERPLCVYVTCKVNYSSIQMLVCKSGNYSMYFLSFPRNKRNHVKCIIITYLFSSSCLIILVCKYYPLHTLFSNSPVLSYISTRTCALTCSRKQTERVMLQYARASDRVLLTCIVFDNG